MKKIELNQNIHLSEGNIKSKATDEVEFLTFSLRSKITCPYSTAECRKRCFAQKNETFKGVRDSRDRNFAETKKETFVKDMIDILEFQLQRKKMKGKKIFVRIHTSGDFYNVEYFRKWVEITDYFKGNDRILFQAYTKSMPIIYEWLYPDDSVEEYEWVNDEPIIYAQEEIKKINIHLVWSIWHDTKAEYTRFAKQIGLQTFTALPKEEIPLAVKNGTFECLGDCGNCRQCYTGKSKTVVIPYH
jgi:hypothetical protein